MTSSPKIQVVQLQIQKKIHTQIQIQIQKQIQIQIQHVTYFHHVKTTGPIEVQDTVEGLGSPELSVNIQWNENSYSDQPKTVH